MPSNAMHLVRRLGTRDNIDQRHRITERLKRWNFNFLGAGYYSAVFTHPRDPKLVIKFGPLDDGWLVYAAWCEAQRGTNNPHLPVIHKIRRYEKHGVYYAVLERLDMTIADAFHSGSPVVTTWNPVRQRFNDGLIHEGGTGWDELSAAAWAAWLAENKMSLVFEDLLCRLRQFAIKHGLGRDLHRGNAMLRKRVDGGVDIVITDPFSEGNRANLEKAMADAVAA